MKNHALYFNNPNEISIRELAIPTPLADEVLVKNIISGISAGTEMLFYQGLMPDDLLLDENIPVLNRQINYPFKYGYCSVGVIHAVGNKKLKHLLNKWVFVFNPHESFFCVKQNQILLIPKDISPTDALFIPNMETAINLLLDGSPLIGENVLVFGLGIVGLLTTAILQQFPLNSLGGIDYHQQRRTLAQELGAKLTLDATREDQIQKYLTDLKPNSVDLIYELTGNPSALNSAISLIGYEGRIVLGSWYGKKSWHFDLGGKFHRNRIKLIASQVSSVASELQGRWNKPRRFEVVFNMLRRIKPSRFISHKFHITNAQQAYQLLQHNSAEALQVILTYEE